MSNELRKKTFLFKFWLLTKTFKTLLEGFALSVFGKIILHLSPSADTQLFRGEGCSKFMVKGGGFFAFLRISHKNKLFCVHV